MQYKIEDLICELETVLKWHLRRLQLLKREGRNFGVQRFFLDVSIVVLR